MRRVTIFCLVILCASYSAEPVVGQPNQEPAAESKPTKQQLVDDLKSLFPLLKQKEYSKAADFFVLPPNFKPEMLDGFIERGEISVEGIQELERAAEFGLAKERFGDERADHFASRASVDVNSVYGFNHESGDVAAEVLAVWDGKNFKLIRLDDVGKLLPSSNPSAEEKMENSSAVANALPVLKAAVEEAPDDVARRAQYAMALYQSSDLKGAWAQLSAARKLQPDHAGVNKGMSVLLSEFEKRGLFSVGRKAEIVKNVLGEPLQTVDLGSRERWVYVYLGVDFKNDAVHEIVDLRGATEALFKPTEYVSVDLDGRGWKCGLRRKSKNYSSAFYYVGGEDMGNWNEQFEVERILNGSKTGSIDAIGELMIQQVKTRFPYATHRVLAKKDDSIIIVFVMPEGPNFQKRHQLVRLLKGPVDVHRIAYTLKVDQPSQETQKTWLAIMKAAELTKVASGQDSDQE